jgi:nucleotide-binding universal stress UspA family protein
VSAVVCGVDASVPARNAARLGAALAGRIGCELQLVHVGEPETGATLLADVSARVGAATASLRVEPGRAADRLAAAGRGAELLVVGRGDGAPWRGRLRGSLARSASCPLIVVPPVAALGGCSVVCGVRDLADSGTVALAGALARLLALPLTLVHVLPPADGQPAPAGVVGRPWEERDAQALLDALGGCAATTRVVRGAAGRELARAAADERAALLVVGAPRNPASPAAWLLRRTPRPLVTVR